MLNLNAIREQDKLRQQLAQATADYLAAGGTIDQPADITAGLTPAHWRDHSDTGIPGASKTEITRQELALADRIRAYAAIGMSTRMIRSKTGLNTTTLRKIAKRHRIALPSGKGREAA
ncbi:hypothetical protein ACFSKY_03945 [Azotobacter chroococcum]|jgi:hypothetical protein|uniref:Uncharacterized protein n=1 Tax=Azotobacter chroococcum TaxID=353 RepID=A0A4R1PVH3_9GAMM|nr:hypothetical protein [Azotobacter chroococcum]TBV98549.1 hypothetical protein E0E53_05865 [Azotobacter chroococcum]TCL34827.1 hypothetical protein EV691_101267 [Azotobacter chroococcum]